ncbi:MAG: hypothetical protein NE330_23090 [Lentisphaeraceae bacterium]|nr:hypothetical protein [Lentisphaeraceae bacterium]
MFKTILLIEKDEFLKDFFTRVLYIDGFEVIYLDSADDLEKIQENVIADLNMVIIDECPDPATFSDILKDCLKKNNRTKPLPVLGVLSKGTDPEASHKSFDAVMIKDNFNIQLLTDLVERLTD